MAALESNERPYYGTAVWRKISLSILDYSFSLQYCILILPKNLCQEHFLPVLFIKYCFFLIKKIWRYAAASNVDQVHIILVTKLHKQNILYEHLHAYLHY